MTKKVKALSIILLTLSIIFTPNRAFSVSANQSLSAPFLGVNINVIDRSTYQRVTSYSFNNLSLSGTDNSEAVSLRCYNQSNGICTEWKAYDNGWLPGADDSELILNFNGSISSQYTTQNTYLYQYEFVLDNYYIGTVDITIGGTINLQMFVNGTSFTTVTVEQFNSVTVNNYDLSVLDSNKNMWVYPVESFLNIMTLFNNGFEQVGIDQYNNYLFPIFNENSNKQISNTQVTTSQKKCVLVMYTSRSVYNATTFNNYFTYNSNFTISEFKYVQRSTSGWIINVTFENTSSSNQTLNLRSIYSSGKFTVIYNTIYYDSYPVSTEFALQFGLNNDMLNNLDIIANGTQSSNQSSSDLADESDDFSQSAGDVYNLEDGFGNDFNTTVNNIDTTQHNLTSFGTGFSNAALWVRNQFETITTNTIYGDVLGFTLIFGMALMIIGKWFG